MLHRLKMAIEYEANTVQCKTYLLFVLVCEFMLSVYWISVDWVQTLPQPDLVCLTHITLRIIPYIKLKPSDLKSVFLTRAVSWLMANAVCERQWSLVKRKWSLVQRLHQAYAASYNESHILWWLFDARHCGVAGQAWSGNGRKLKQAIVFYLLSCTYLQTFWRTLPHAS